MYGEENIIDSKSFLDKDVIKEVLAKKLERRKGEMTHDEIGKKTGFSGSYIAKILNKKQDISPQQFKKIAKLGFDMTDNEIKEAILEARAVEFDKINGNLPRTSDIKEFLDAEFSESEIEEVEDFLKYLKSKR